MVKYYLLDPTAPLSLGALWEPLYDQIFLRNRALVPWMHCPLLSSPNMDWIIRSDILLFFFVFFIQYITTITIVTAQQDSTKIMMPNFDCAFFSRQVKEIYLLQIHLSLQTLIFMSERHNDFVVFLSKYYFAKIGIYLSENSRNIFYIFPCVPTILLRHHPLFRK